MKWIEKKHQRADIHRLSGPGSHGFAAAIQKNKKIKWPAQAERRTRVRELLALDNSHPLPIRACSLEFCASKCEEW